MKNEKTIKRPKFGKPFLLRPLKTTLKDKSGQKGQFNDFLTVNKIGNTNTKPEKNIFIDSFMNKEIQNKCNDILENNLKKFDDINEKKDKLKNINLIEKDIEDLYDWSNLLNNFRPISCYISNRKPLNIQNEKRNLKHTVIECNKNDKNIRRINNQKKKLLIAKHSPRNNSFYFSHYKTLNNFYKKNKINFSERIKFLKPKLKSNSFKLKNQIKTQRILSAKKEKVLNNKLNLDEINLEKKDLIIANERKNPIPLLQSIFKQIYKEDENDKLCTNNSMKTLSIENNLDNHRNNYLQLKPKNKNKSEILDYNYNYYNGNNTNQQRNLILSYYNKDDAYIQIFNRIIDKNKKYNDNANNENEKIYNPILQKFDDNCNPHKLLLINKNIQNKNSEKKEEDYSKNNANNTNKNNQKLKNIRPKTGFRPSNNIINNPWANRPQTSNIRKYKETIEQIYSNYDPSTDIANSSNSNSFPIKTLTNAGNAPNDKINKIIKERKLNINNIKYDYIIPTKELNNINNNISSKKSFNKIYNTKKNKNSIKNSNKWNNHNEYYNKKKIRDVNYYDFDDVVNNLLIEHNNNNLYSLNYYKNIGGKYYSGCNNVNAKSIRNEKNKKLKKIHTDFVYSKDDHEIDYKDEACSTYKENYSFQKI